MSFRKCAHFESVLRLFFSQHKIVRQEFHAAGIQICNAPFFCAIEKKKNCLSRLQCSNFYTFSSQSVTCFDYSVMIECCVILSVNANVEARLVVQAVRVNTLSKLTFADSKRFDALVRDIFPGVDFKGVEYAELADALRAAAQESNLMVMETQVRGRWE